MQPTFRFTVVSELPEQLSALQRLAVNLRWAWDEQIASVFDRLDDRPVGQRWRDVGEHPYALVRSISPARLAELADDHGFLAAVEHASARLADAVDGPSWYGDRDARPLATDGGTGGVAYFSPEFGITEMLPQYSGGLGILAGDHLKASSDLGIPGVPYFEEREGAEVYADYPAIKFFGEVPGGTPQTAPHVENQV